MNRYKDAAVRYTLLLHITNQDNEKHGILMKILILKIYIRNNNMLDKPILERKCSFVPVTQKKEFVLILLHVNET